MKLKYWKKNSDGVNPTGLVRVSINGEVVEESDNLVVNNGRALLAERFLASPTNGPITHSSIGTGTGAAQATDTALTEPTTVTRVAISPSRSGSQITAQAQFGANNPTDVQTIGEAGLFTADTAGILYARFVFSQARVKQTADTVTVDWTLNF